MNDQCNFRSKWKPSNIRMHHKLEFVKKQYRAFSKSLENCMQLFSFSGSTDQKQLAKPIRCSMLIFHEPISSDNFRTLNENCDKGKSRSFHVFVSYNRTWFYSFFLVQVSNSKDISLKRHLINFSELKTTPTSLTYSDSSSWEVQSHKPKRREKETDTNLYQPHSTGHKNAIENKGICSVIDEYGRADCPGSAYNSECWLRLWNCEFLCQI